MTVATPTARSTAQCNIVPRVATLRLSSCRRARLRAVRVRANETRSAGTFAPLPTRASRPRLGGPSAGRSRANGSTAARLLPSNATPGRANKQAWAAASRSGWADRDRRRGLDRDERSDADLWAVGRSGGDVLFVGDAGMILRSIWTGEASVELLANQLGGSGDLRGLSGLAKPLRVRGLSADARQAARVGPWRAGCRLAATDSSAPRW